MDEKVREAAESAAVELCNKIQELAKETTCCAELEAMAEVVKATANLIQIIA